MNRVHYEGSADWTACGRKVKLGKKATATSQRAPEVTCLRCKAIATGNPSK